MRYDVTRYKMKNWWCEIMVWNDDVIWMCKMTMWNNVNLCHNDMMWDMIQRWCKMIWCNMMYYD